MAVFLYGFLAVIALIGFFNMINCIAMSVSSRLKEYGAMRAVGMGMGQFLRMVFGEAAAYALFGSFFGLGIGIPLNRKLFLSLVTFRWGGVVGISGMGALGDFRSDASVPYPGGSWAGKRDKRNGCARVILKYFFQRALFLWYYILYMPKFYFFGGL